MDKIARIKAAVAKERCDCLPFAFWTHLPAVDRDPLALAEATYQFFKEYDIDFVKTMNNGMYSIEDYDCQIDFSEIPLGGVAKLVKSPIRQAADLARLTAPAIGHGALARELKSLALLVDKLQGSAPVVFTVFTPLTTLQKMCGAALLAEFLVHQPDLVHQALDVITQSTAVLANQAIAIGADGIFLANQMGSYDVLTARQYEAFGKPYDLQVLAGAQEGWFNILHAHGNNIIFEIFKDYPVDVLNWHVGETLPELEEARDISGKCILGGLNRTHITQKNINQIQNQIYHALKALQGRGHILAPGCVIRYPLDRETLKSIRVIKEMVEERMNNLEKGWLA